MKKNNWRNNYHIDAPYGLINDPNGLSYFNGCYHIFYQWNPNGCDHKTKHWGLVKTKDFLKFSSPQIILKPEDHFDKNGCYSGCGHVKDGVLNLFYTGNVRNEKNERESYQCLAKYYENGDFEKKGVVIDSIPKGYTAHFRDPMIFKHEGTYYMVIGAQRENLTGSVVIYVSQDLENFLFKGELSTNLKDFGYMWECPNLFKISKDKYALLFSPQGLKEEEFKYQNLYQSGYIIGDIDFSSMDFKDHSEFKEIDHGFDFYAPQVFKKDDENIMIGWIGMPEKESEYPTSLDGWIFSLTLPRRLFYKDGNLYQQPIDEVLNLRDSRLEGINNVSLSEYLFNTHKRALEIEFNLNIENQEFIEIKLEFESEYITLYYYKKEEIFILSRENMIKGGRGVRKFKLRCKDTLSIRMFIDKSIIEVYYEEGLESTTFMYFPSSNDMSLKISGSSPLSINTLNIWSLKEIIYE